LTFKHSVGGGRPVGGKKTPGLNVEKKEKGHMENLFKKGPKSAGKENLKKSQRIEVLEALGTGGVRAKPTGGRNLKSGKERQADYPVEKKEKKTGRELLRKEDINKKTDTKGGIAGGDTELWGKLEKGEGVGQLAEKH